MRSNLMLMEPMTAYDWQRRVAAIELDAATRVSTEQIRDSDQVAVSVDRNIAFLRIHGVIEKRLSLGGFLFGGTSTEAFGQAFQSAVDDSSIKGIVVSIDSPGGRYPGTPELAQQIYQQRGAKGKADRNLYEPLTEAARAEGQKVVDEIYEEFVEAVARRRRKSRGEVEQNFGQGRMLSAREPVGMGMCERVARLSDVPTRIDAGQVQRTALRSANQQRRWQLTVSIFQQQLFLN